MAIPRCPHCEEKIPRNIHGKFNKTCGKQVCITAEKSERKRQSKKRCPICENVFFAYADQPVCEEWECRRSAIRAKNWGVPLEAFHDEVRSRDRQQYHIDRAIGLNQINMPEIRISIGQGE